jgi:hypothetical protein
VVRALRSCSNILPAHSFSGGVSERAIRRLDVLGCPFAKLRKIKARILNRSTHRQIRAVDLQIETRGHDRLVFEPHGRHAGARLRLLRELGPRCPTVFVRKWDLRTGGGQCPACPFGPRPNFGRKCPVLRDSRWTVEFIPVQICLFSDGDWNSVFGRRRAHAGNASVMPPYSS